MNSYKPPAPSYYTLQRGVYEADAETLRVRDVSPTLWRLIPDVAPLLTISSKTKKGKAIQGNLIEWFEDQPLNRFDTLNGAMVAGDGSMTVTTYARFRAGDLVLLPSGEIVLVTATPSSTTVSITRGVGAVAAGTGSVGDTLFIFSAVSAEGSDTRDLLTTVKVPKYNYTQIIKHPFAYSGTLEQTNTYTGKENVNLQVSALLEHKRLIENTFIFGQRAKIAGSATAQYKLSMNGIKAQISTNVVHLGGASFTEDQFEDFIRISSYYGSTGEKMVFMSPKPATLLNGWARGKLHPTEVDGKYGVTVTQYKNTGRVVKLHEHKELANYDQADLTGIAGMIFCIDPKMLEMRYVNGRAALYRMNIQTPSVDGREDEYLSEMSCMLMQEPMHGMMDGIVS